MLAAALFYALSNFQVWLTGDGITYPHTLAGLVACYVAAIPFAVNMLWGNLFYCGAMFGAWALLQRKWPALSADSLGSPAIAR